MDGEINFPIGSFAPKKKRSLHTTGRISKPKDGQYNLQYFSQVLDIETICSNALRNLKNDEKINENWTNDLLAEEWKYKFDIPIITKY